MTYCYECGKDVELDTRIGDHTPKGFKNRKHPDIICEECQQKHREKLASKLYHQRTKLLAEEIKRVPESCDLYKYIEKRGIRKLEEKDQLNEINLPTANFNSDLYIDDIKFMKDYGVNISKLMRILVHHFVLDSKHQIGVK